MDGSRIYNNLVVANFELFPIYIINTSEKTKELQKYELTQSQDKCCLIYS